MRAEVDVDVVVAGLGVLGAAAVAALADRGLSVVGLDRHHSPNPHGSSHGGSRIIRRVYAEGSLYVPLVDRAYALWRELERRSDRRLLLPGGGLFLGDRDGELVRGARACARERGLDHELLSTAQLRRRFPALSPPEGISAVFDPAAGVLLAESCVEALLEVAAAEGAELRFGHGIDGWSAKGHSVQIDCAGESLRARHLLLATGPWLASTAGLAATAGLATNGGQAGLSLEVERQLQHWFEPSAGDPRATRLPPFVWQLSTQRTWYVLPDVGAGLKAGIHRGGELTTADTVRRGVDPAEVEEATRLVRRYLPGVTAGWRESAACMYANTADLRFLAGPLPAQQRVWALGGGSGHAFKFAPALGELIAEGIAQGGPPAALGPFLPERPA